MSNVLTTKTPRFRKSGAVGEAIKAFVAGARVLAGCCSRLGAGVPVFSLHFQLLRLAKAWLWALGLGTPEKANTAAWRQITISSLKKEKEKIPRDVNSPASSNGPALRH